METDEIKMKQPTFFPGPPAAWHRQQQKNRRQCRRVLRAAHRARRRAVRRQTRQRLLRRIPGWQAAGELLYRLGFRVEYTLLCLLRALYGLLRVAWWTGATLLAPLVPRLPAVSLPLLSPRRLLSWLPPAGAALVLVLTLRTGLSLRFVLQVEVNGSVLGRVESEEIFEAAQADVRSRVNNARQVLAEAGQQVPEDLWAVEPSYALTVGGRTLTQSDLVNELLRQTGGALTEATAVYIDGTLSYVITGGDHLRSYLEQIKKPYRQSSEPGRTVSFYHDIRLVDGLFLQDSVVPDQTVLDALNVPGETGTPELLRVQVVVRETQLSDIPYDTVTTTSDAYDYGETVVVQPGELGLQEITQDTTYLDGQMTNVEIVGTRVLKEPVTEEVIEGTRIADALTGRYDGRTFVWPVPDYREVTRWMGAGHTGTDIAASYGVPVIAAADGVVKTLYHWNGVVTQGDYNSYGNYIELDHGGGYRTLYGHLSAFAVEKGETVTQGQVIGYVGDTGYAFGYHCHFEMFGPNGRFSAREVFPGL